MLSNRTLLSWVLAAVVAPSAWAGNVTEFQVAQGSWASAESWSAGVPETGWTATVDNGGTAQITAAGSECGSLVIGSSMASTVSMFFGGLSVDTSIDVGGTADGRFDVFGGTASTPALAIHRGHCSVSNGVLDIESATVGNGTDGAVLDVSAIGTLDCSGSLLVRPGANLAASGGTVVVGTTTSDEVLVEGAYSVTFTPTVTFQSLRFAGGPDSGMNVFIGSGGTSATQVAGTANIDGTLTIADLGAPNGRYDIISAGAVSGTFAEFILPAGWAFGSDATTVWVEKGVTPVVTTSWTETKRAF